MPRWKEIHLLYGHMCYEAIAVVSYKKFENTSDVERRLRILLTISAGKTTSKVGTDHV